MAWRSPAVKDPERVARPTAPIRSHHVPLLDGFRGLAIVAVMFCHSFFRAFNHSGRIGDTISAVARYGTHGVDMFFLLSGYLITGILVRTRDEQNYYAAFYVRRTLRIFPLYYATAFIVLIIFPLVWGGAKRELAPTLPHQEWIWFYGVNFFPFFNPGRELTYFVHFWTLAIEEQFYLFWPFLFGRFKPEQLIPAMFVMVGAIWLVTAMEPLLPIRPERLLTQTTPLRVDMLALGAILAMRNAPAGSAWSYRRIAGSALVLAVAMTIVSVAAPALFHTSQEVPSAIRIVVRRLLVVSLFTGLLAVREGSLPHRVMTSSAMRFFGRYSYGLYVFHSMIGLAVARAGLTGLLLRRAGSELAGVVVNTVVFTTIAI